MSKEQREGQAPDPRHDLYSLGVLWYQLLVGDVTRAMSHGWTRELAVHFATPREQIELIERCVGWMPDRPSDAGELLKLVSPLTEKATQEGAIEPPQGLLGGVPLPRAPTSNSAGAGEDSRYRHLRFVIRMKQVRESHERVKVATEGFGIGCLVTLVGIMVMTCAGVPAVFVASGFSWVLLEWVLLVLAFEFVLLTVCAFLSGRETTKAVARAQQALAARIEEVLTEFPQECQACGGRAALADREVLEGVLRELETAQL